MNGYLEPSGARDVPSGEPGEVDNRLSLNPDDFPMTKKWEDGETYAISELGDAQIRQISPGEFEVMPEQPEEVAPEEEEEAAPPTRGGRTNPAVERLIAQEG